jgi:hypothetical protein
MILDKILALPPSELTSAWTFTNTSGKVGNSVISYKRFNTFMTGHPW